MQVIKDSTDITTYFVLRDSTTHAPKTDVTVTDIDLYYVSHKTAISSKADATALDAANSAHADNKAFNVGQGVYRIDWPDIWSRAFGTTVNLIVVCSGVDTEFLECEIVGTPQTSADIKTVTDKLDSMITEIEGDYLFNNFALYSAYYWLDQNSSKLQTLTDATYGLSALSARIPAALESGNIAAVVKSQDNIDFGAIQKASIAAAVPTVADIVGDMTAYKSVANSLAKMVYEINQSLNGVKVVVDDDAGTVKVYDTAGTTLLFTLTKTAVGNTYTITRA